MDPRKASLVRSGTLVLAAVLLALGSSLSQEGLAAPGDILVEAQVLDGSRLEGRLQALGSAGATLQTAGGAKVLPWGSLYRMEVVQTKAGPPLGGSRLRAHLVGGERIQGHFAGPSSDGLVLETADAGSVTIRFDALRSLASIPADAPPCHEPEARFPPIEGDDVAYDRSGDATTGLLLRADPAGLVLEAARKQERTVAWDDLAVMHLENAPPKADGKNVIEVATTAGDVYLAAGPPSMSDGHVEMALRSDPGIRVRIPLERVRSLRAHGKDYVFASDLPFTSTFETPYPTAEDDPTKSFLGAWYGARANLRPSGCRLTMHGVTYEHGFAVHARSRVTLKLAKGFGSFRTLVGVDDLALAAAGGGIVDARVLGDGEVLWRAEGLESGQPPRAVGPINVSEVDELVLEIDFGRDQLHVRDHATWADPVLVRK